MLDELLLATTGSTVLLGTVLCWMRRAESRKARLDARLKTIGFAASETQSSLLSLRRPVRARRVLPAILSTRLDLALAATGERIAVLHLVAAGIIATATGLAAAMMLFRPALAVLFAGAAGICAPVLLLRIAQSRYQRQFLEIFPEALDLIVRAVRAGLPTPEAIEAATREAKPPVGKEFERVLDEMRIGVEMADALQRAAARIRVPDFHFFVVSLLLQRKTGGGLAETLSNLSTIIRQRKALRLKARAPTAEATASAAVVAATPFVAGIGLFLINPALMSVLLVDPRGRFMLAVAVVSLLSGIAAMKAMIRRSTR